MYRGTLSSFFDNNFKYNIKTRELPLGLIMPVRCEAFVFSDNGRRSIIVEIETEDELIFVKSKKATLVLEIPCKVKFTLEKVTIRRDGKEYLLEFSNACYNPNL